MIEQVPPEPTAEEIAAREEAAKAAAAAAAKKGQKGAAPTEVVEEKVEPVLVESPPDFMDTLFDNDRDLEGNSHGPCSTLTLKNGLIVRHMPNGDVV